MGAHIIAPGRNFLRVRLQPRPMRQRVDAESRVPDQQPRDRSSPNQSSDPVSPSILRNQTWQDEPREQRDLDVVPVLEPHDDVGLEVASLDELHTGVGGFAEDPAAVGVPQPVCGRVWIVDW